MAGFETGGAGPRTAGGADGAGDFSPGTEIARSSAVRLPMDGTLWDELSFSRSGTFLMTVRSS